tara:strand:- start:6875 stop:7231 length:357 start_codon:yes stop_codon:yes gene_type:complete
MGKGFGSLHTLTDGERLYIVRRRKKRTQKEAAALYGVSRVTYNRWENGLAPGPTEALTSLFPYERCLINRRRSGSSQGALSNRLKISRNWLNQMENGNIDCKPLIDYWEPKEESAAIF